MSRLLIGIGGAGNNTVNNIIEENELQIDTLVINSDKKGLEASLSKNKIFLDTEKHESLENAFKNISSKLSTIVTSYSNVFIVLGLGGDCGTSIIKVLHQVIKDKDVILKVVGIMPFNYEGAVRKKKALDTVIKTKSKYKELKLFENQSLFETASSNTTFLEAFKFMDNNIASYIKNN